MRERRRLAFDAECAAWYSSWAHDDGPPAALVPLLPKVGGVIAAYLPFGSEPPAHLLIERLDRWDVVVPDPAARLGVVAWRRVGSMRASGEGLARVGLVIVPALAVDELGTRLGQGGGWYDRALIAAPPTTPLVAMVNAAEFLPAGVIVRQGHDIPMTHALLPSGLAWLNARPGHPRTAGRSGAAPIGSPR